MKTKRIRIALEATTLTHLVCIACGSFHCDLEVSNGDEPQAGLHKRCMKLVQVKRNRDFRTIERGQSGGES